MFDRIFSTALVFGMLVASTAAIATAMLETTVERVVQLPRVEIVAKRDLTVTSAGTRARSCG